jgi:hypothetical protein
MLPLSVTLQVVFVALVQPPVHEENVFPLAVFGAPRMYCVPEVAVSVKGVVPRETRLLNGLPTEIDTPLLGFDESTVSV